MRIQAKYRNMVGWICWKYFHNIEEMENWFKKFRQCKYISHEEGDHIEAEALRFGYK